LIHNTLQSIKYYDSSGEDRLYCGFLVTKHVKEDFGKIVSITV